MTSLFSIDQLDCKDKMVIVRGDLDIKVEDGELKDDTRIKELMPTLSLLLDRGANKIALIGHRGRPDGFDENLTLSPIAEYLKTNFNPDVTFIPHKPMNEFFESFDQYSQSKSRLCVFDNLRFYKEEEGNSQTLIEQLSYLGECFINESFASAHREHASVFGVPKFMKEKGKQVGAGLHLIKEVENLSRVREDPKRPLVILISGAKEDKLTFLPQLTDIADRVLIGGRLPEFMPEEEGNAKLLVAHLIPDKEDITIHSIEQFEQVVASAGTIFISGPLGKFEEEGHLLGTQRVLTAISKSGAIKIAGGGDTTSAIKALKLENAFDWISTGGGASLEFVAKGTLPGIEILKI